MNTSEFLEQLNENFDTSIRDYPAEMAAQAFVNQLLRGLCDAYIMCEYWGSDDRYYMQVVVPNSVRECPCVKLLEAKLQERLESRFGDWVTVNAYDDNP